MNPWNELLANFATVAITTSLWTFGHRHVVRVMSIGTATMNVDGVRGKKDLLRSADEALYAAKATGRDCVRSCDPDDAAVARV
jgi:GGDEF domain-containing protein